MCICVDNRLYKMCRRQDCPTEGQLKALSHVAARLEKELTEERSGLVATTADEPLFDLIHGIPGAGKSRVIAWICELFTDILGWTNGIQFVCLAVQNTMAADIGGSTIHHWGSIAWQEGQQKSVGSGEGGKRDTSSLFNRCLNLRWLLYTSKNDLLDQLA